jgi:hypothetical protein
VRSIPAQNGTFLSAFPMFVPSLSWQNDHFYIKSGQKVPFCRTALTREEVELLRQNGTFLSFPYVCPEPVLVQ